MTIQIEWWCNNCGCHNDSVLKAKLQCAGCRMIFDESEVFWNGKMKAIMPSGDPVKVNARGVA